MRERIMFLIFILMVASGCAAIRQAREDIATSNATPLSEGEVDPAIKGRQIAGVLSGLPYGASIVAVPLASLFLANWFRWRRGRKIRLGVQPLSEKPITGNLGETVGLEWLVQWLADMRAAVFEVGKDGSGAKRGWKGLLYAAIGSSAFAPVFYPAIIDSINSFAAHPPQWLGGAALTVAVAAGTGIVAFLEKQIDKVLPLKKDNPVAISTATLTGI